ncbi:Glyceraldehyde-3-phosphate dehydrogenase [Phaeobacter inhibens]|uniref:Uncharacterized protein n=1 Tax=Phaeobacter porticola TaxID=1844006 RepID=A0A1L3I4T1_9RHOB|nr:hypothetical protein PhaeoP97_01729 [Phaeobacter porticola]
MGLLRADGGRRRRHGPVGIIQTAPSTTGIACNTPPGQAYLTGRIFWAGPMTNRIAIILALLIITAVAIDIWIYGQVHMVFLGKRLFELLDWIAFWR